MTRVFFGNDLSYPVPETITNHHYRLQTALWDGKSLENLFFLRFYFDMLGQEKAGYDVLRRKRYFIFSTP